MLKLRGLVILFCVLLFTIPVLAQDEYTVSLGSSDDLGSYLVGPNGMTLYVFTPDPLNTSVCNGRCAENWPPLTVDSADGLTADEGIPGQLGTTVRDDGSTQVTYNGQPLYYWAKDVNPGDTTGNRVNRVWWIVPPATVSALPNPDFGSVLVGPNGMTVYVFDNDEMGVSNCTGDCATNWPPVTVDSADAVVPGVNLPGEFGTTQRDDGTLQVIYNGMPLYNWKNDAAIGDTTGEGLGDKWHTVTPETVAIGHTDELGDFLVAADGRTLYAFANDEMNVSNCSGDCATNWPPLTVAENQRLVAGSGTMGELGTITRDDDSLQLTYNGMPLYLWKDDQLPGDTGGNGLGGKWSVVAP